jgi:glutaredoxin-like protein
VLSVDGAETIDNHPVLMVSCMNLIPQRTAEYLKTEFSKQLQAEVTLLVFTQEVECPSCRETRELIQELVPLNPKISVKVLDFLADSDTAKKLGVDKIPAVVFDGTENRGIRFYGLPAGYEFRALVEDIVDISSSMTRLSQVTKNQIREITYPVHIQVFTIPTCPYCPQMVRLAHQFAMESGLIQSDMVSAIEFPQLAQKYAVMAVPKTVINDVIEIVGEVPEAYFIEQILLAAKP